MNAKDLMIGDWVFYSEPNQYLTRVDEILRTSDNQPLYYIAGKRDPKDHIQVEDVNLFACDILFPIPLTPEILEKNGFELQDGWYRPFRKIGDDDIAIRLPKKCDMYQYTEFEYSKLCYNPEDVTESEFDCSMTIKGVANLHELQHFMRFCGIEKEIVL